MLRQNEIMQTLDMIDHQHLDIRTITMGISLRDCCGPDPKRTAQKIYDKITHCAQQLVPTGEAIEREFGIPIVNKRISVTPISMVAESCERRKLARVNLLSGLRTTIGRPSSRWVTPSPAM